MVKRLRRVLVIVQHPVLPQCTTRILRALIAIWPYVRADVAVMVKVVPLGAVVVVARLPQQPARQMAITPPPAVMVAITPPVQMGARMVLVVAPAAVWQVSVPITVSISPAP